MLLTRRQFNRRIAAAAASLPLLNPRAFAADAPARRLVLIWSLGTDNKLWRPTSAPGADLVLPACTAPLMAAKDSVVMVDGLSFCNPNDQHSTPQPFTGVANSGSGARGGKILSIDQYILAKQPAATRIPSLFLGVQAKNEGLCFNGQRLVPNDDPANAFQTAFAGAAPAMSAATPAASAGLPRTAILDQVRNEIKDLQKALGSAARARLDQHLQALAQLEKNAAPLATGGDCKPAMPSGIGGAEDSGSTLANGAAHLDIIAQAFACDVTRIGALQWGISNNQNLSVPGGVIEEHGPAVHGGDNNKLAACESALCTALVDFIGKLKATPDPSGQGTLLDNTLIFWTRDMGQARAHTQFAIPTVLAGGSGYLATRPGGSYVRLDGDDDAGKKSSKTHDAVLHNLAEWMGVSDMSGFGMSDGASAPLAEIKQA